MADPSGGYDEGAQVSMTLPPTKQYQGSPMLNLRSKTVAGLVQLVQQARQDPVLGEFFVASGFAQTQAGAEAVVASAGLTAVADPSRDGPLPPASGGKPSEGDTCPECGKGKLKVKKGSRGNFLGCDAFPKCRHIAGDA